jgi:hypothetical protein
VTYNHVTVIARYQNESGEGQSGVVQWAPTGPIVDSTLHVTITPDTDNITLDSTGTATASLLAMDDPGLSTGWAWAFKPTVSGVPDAIQYVSVDYANGATQYIDELAPVVPTAGMAAYATASMLATETASRVAGDAATLSSAAAATASAVGAETTRATTAEGVNTAAIAVPANRTAHIFSPLNYGAVGDGTTNDDTAIHACFTAAAAAHGIVDLGDLTYLTSTPIPTFSGMRVRGSSQEGGKILNNSSAIFTMTSGNFDITFEDCALQASAGHIWDATAGPSLSFIRILGVKATQTGTGYSLWSQLGGSFIDCQIDKKCNFTMSASATVPGWNVLQTNVTSVVFDHLRTNAGNNNNVPFFNFDMQSVASYSQDIVFKNTVVEQSPSGGFSFAGVFGVTLEHCRGWDASAFTGNFIQFLTSAGGYTCRNIRVIESAQIQHGAGAGSFYDIYADSNCTNVTLDTVGTWGTLAVVSTPALHTTVLNTTGTSLSVPSVATFPAVKVAGITGAVAALRFVGCNATGAPTTGPHLVGDVAASQTGVWYFCTVAGTPGTWTASTMAGDVTGTSVASVVSKIQGTTIAAPSGGTSKFLNATGAWSIPPGISPPSGFPVPSALGYIAWTGDPQQVGLTSPAAAAYPSGAMSLARMDAPPSTAVNGYVSCFWITAAGLANTFIGAYDSSGNQLGVTADLSAQTAGLKRFQLVGMTTTPADGIVYIVYLNGTSGVAAGPKYFPGLTAVSTAFLLSAPGRASHVTGSLTALAGSITLSGFSTNWYTYGFYAID